ncbi:MAG: hypothetical protein IKO35_05575 [Elusimicrobiaceae bacterium]|nr:hypothetical protein [Elusimicrobiaceae bacterium]
MYFGMYRDMFFAGMVALFFFYVGPWMLLRNYLFFRRAILVTGTVTSYKVVTKGSCPVEVITFYFDGQAHQIESILASDIKSKIGQLRKVGVDPQDVRKVRVMMTKEQKAIAWVFTAMLVLFVAVVISLFA